MTRRLALVGALLVLLGACGEEPTAAPSSSPLGSPSPSETPVDEATEAESPPSTAGCEDLTAEEEIEVHQTDNAFSPDCVVGLAGQGLEIENEGSNLHNFSIEGTQVDLDTRPGEKTETEAIGGIVDPGTYEFFCRFHRSQGMDGEITIVEAG